MFLKSSRYYNLDTVDTVTDDGQAVKAVVLRRLPSPDSLNSNSVIIKENARLDIMAFRKYANATKFWHIADANTDLQANDLVNQTNRVIQVPEQ